jgi:leucyl/phenylalanyl-tRNA--protein transferase
VSIEPDDIVAVGAGLDPATLLAAYRRGVFPWPVPGLPMLWFCPRERGILEFDRFHVSRRLARLARSTSLRASIDADFPAVIRACADTPRPGQSDTWILPEIIAAYVRLHRLGHAHSVEVWDGSRLVGGVYGVDVDGAFAAESMFHREPNASKLALIHLVEHLRRGGLDWMDVQVLSPHLVRLGAHSVPRVEFLRRLRATRALGRRPFGP